jgi:hypothetical protein
MKVRYTRSFAADHRLYKEAGRSETFLEFASTTSNFF